MKRKRAFIALSILGSGILSVLAVYLMILAGWRRGVDEYQKRLDEKLAAAEMVLYYELSQNTQLRVKLTPDDREVKIISHLNVPRTIPHDREYLYGLHVRVLDNDRKELWDNIYWEETRATRIKLGESPVEWESAFYIDHSDVTPTDGRLTTVFLSSVFQDAAKLNRAPGYLQVSLVSGEYQSAVARLYRKLERPPEDRYLAWKRLSHAARLELAQSNVYSMDMLTEEEKTRLMTYKWERIAAEGKRGRDYRIQHLYLSNLRELRASGEVVSPYAGNVFLIHPLRFACLNIKGEGRLKVEIASFVRSHAAGEDKPSIVIQRLDDTGEMTREERILQMLSASEGSVGEVIIDVPSGLHTYSIRSSAACYARFYVDRAPEMLMEYDLPAIHTSDWNQIEPRTSVVTYYRSPGADDSPAVEAHISYNRLYGSSIRIASRLRFDTAYPADPRQYVVHYDILDGEGRSILKGSYTAKAAISVYDFYYHPQIGTETEYIPGEINLFHLTLPRQAETMRLYSEEIVDFALYSYYGGSGRQVYITDSDMNVRSVVFYDYQDHDREWFYFRPSNYQKLDESGRAVHVRLQYRMLREREGEREQEEESEGIQKIARIITPDIYAEEVSLLEKAEQDDDRLYGSDTTFFEAGLNEDIPIEFADRSNPHNQLPVSMEAIYRSVTVDKGSTMNLSINGRSYGEYPLSSEAGNIYVEEIPQGTQAVRFSASPSRCRLFVNRLPFRQSGKAIDPVLWKRRTSYRLSRGHPIILSIQKESRKAKTLNVMVYRGAHGDCSIGARIRSTFDRLPSQDYTASERTYHIRAWRGLEAFEMAAGSWQSGKQLLTMTLGEDMGAGEHLIQFDMVGEGTALLRFLVMEDRGYIINSTHSAALNVIGPGTLKLELTIPAITSGQEAVHRIIAKRVNFRGEVVIVERQINGVSELEFAVPDGLHTYSFSTPEEADCSIRFYVDRAPEMLTGEYRLLSHPELYERIEPESYVTRYYHTSDGESTTPVVVKFPDVETNARRTIRIASRIRLKGLPQRYSLHYETVTATGETVSSGTKDVSASETAFYDRYFSPGHGGLPSEPFYFYINPSPDAHLLRIWSDNRDVSLAFYSQSRGYIRDTYVPEDRLDSEGVNIWDSSHNRQWYPLTPDNHTELFLAGRSIRVESQKLMIEERDVETGIDSRKLWRTVIPEVYQAEVDVLEKVRADLLWQKRTFYALAPGEPLKLSLYKEGDLALNVAGYFEASDRERIEMRVVITPEFPLLQTEETSEECTPRESMYYINSSPDEVCSGITPVLFKPSDSGGLRQFAVRLRDDLKAGKYDLTFELTGKAKGMLRFFFSEEAPFVLRERQSAVLNLIGPGNLKVEAINQEMEQFLRISIVTATGEFAVRDISLMPAGGSEPSAHVLPVPPGFSSVSIENTSQSMASLRFHVDRPSEMLVDDGTPVPYTDGQGWLEIRPDVQTYSYFLCSPRRDGLEILLPRTQDGDYTLRLTARLPVEVGKDEKRGCDVTYQFLDDEGRGILEGRFAMDSEPSYDAFYYPAQFHAEVPGKPVYRYIELPEKAAVLRLGSERPIHFRFHRRPSAMIRRTYVPEDYSRPGIVQSSGGTDPQSEWELLTPENHNTLAYAGKPVMVDTQRRLVDYPPTVKVDDLQKVARVIDPDAYSEKVYVFEPCHADDLSGMEPSAVTYYSIAANEDITLDVVSYDSPGGQAPADVQLIYRFPRLWLEGYTRTYPVIAFFMDGECYGEFPVMSPLGRLLIPDAPTGIHRCRVVTWMPEGVDMERLELFINQTPCDLKDISVWKQRTVYTLEQGKSLAVSVTKPREEAVTLNVVCYYDNRKAEEDERFTVLATIDDGIRPMQRNEPSSEYTPLLREYSVRNQPSSAFYLDKEGVEPGESQTFFVPLNDDIPPGQHRVVFRLLSGESARIRFFIMESQGREERVRYWGKAE